MGIENFIPEIWDAKIYFDFKQAAIFAGLCDRSYEGVLTKGGTVKVTTGVPIEVHDYKAGMLLDAEGNPIPRTTKPDKISTTQVDLTISEEKSYDFEVDDIDRVQAAGNLADFTGSAGDGLVEDADSWIAAQIYAASTKLASANLSTAKAVWNAIRDLKKVLDKASVPLRDRTLVLNAEAVGNLMEYDSKFTSMDMSGSTDGLREAAIGRVQGFNTFQSENLPITDKPMLQAFLKGSFAFVSQVQKSEAMRAQDSFADRVRGLHVYGGKAVRPVAMAAIVGS